MTKAELAKQVDRLGALQAQIADLEKIETAIKNELKAIGDGAFEGDLFRATVATSNRETLDMKAVREKLTPQFIAAHTKVTEVTVIKVVARTNGALGLKVAA